MIRDLINRLIKQILVSKDTLPEKSKEIKMSKLSNKNHNMPKNLLKWVKNKVILLKNSKKELEISKKRKKHTPSDLKKIVRLTKKLGKELKKQTVSFYQKIKKFLKSFLKNKKYRQTTIKTLRVKIRNFFRFIRLEAIIILRKKNDEESLNISSKPIIIGVWSTFFLFGTFFLWSIIAKIDSTAIAESRVVLSSNKKTIQHLEGGIIDEIFVKDGDLVITGQELIRLSETSSKANQDLLNKQLASLKATKIRLEAERDEKNMPDFSVIKQKFKGGNEFDKIIRGERELFATRKKSIIERVGILNQKINQLNEEIAALKAQQEAVSERFDLTKSEFGSLSKLYQEGIISRTDFINLKKEMAELEGSKGEYVANISKVQQAISEAELEITNIKTERLNEVIKELQEVQSKVGDLEERIIASSDVLERTIIRSPYSGIVNASKFHSHGGVIAPGTEIMEIIPQDDELIIEARVSPQDIDVVHVGLKAKVRLSAYKAKAVPPLRGEVINVSGDSVLDQVSGVTYFAAKIKINPKDLKNLKDVRLYPGMPAESYIITGSRTFLAYLFDPITVSMRRAFREE